MGPFLSICKVLQSWFMICYRIRLIALVVPTLSQPNRQLPQQLKDGNLKIIPVYKRLQLSRYIGCKTVLQQQGLMCQNCILGVLESTHGIFVLLHISRAFLLKLGRYVSRNLKHFRPNWMVTSHTWQCSDPQNTHTLPNSAICERHLVMTS